MEEVASILPGVFRRRLRPGGATLVDFLAPFWSRVSGKHIAQHSSPIAFEAGTLTLVTDCPSWAVGLRQMSEEVRAAINNFLGEPVVKNVRVLRRDSFAPQGPAAREREIPPGVEVNQIEGLESAAQLGPEIAKTVELSFTKYFARNARRAQ